MNFTLVTVKVTQDMINKSKFNNSNIIMHIINPYIKPEVRIEIDTYFSELSLNGRKFPLSKELCNLDRDIIEGTLIRPHKIDVILPIKYLK